MRFIGLDVHRDFCEVAIHEDGEIRSAGRVETSPEQLELFAQSLGPDDRVAVETTENALTIAKILERHIGGVLVAARQTEEDYRAVVADWQPKDP